MLNIVFKVSSDKVLIVASQDHSRIQSNTARLWARNFQKLD